jgi:transcriptional regulator with XRE-family HTH domain
MEEQRPALRLVPDRTESPSEAPLWREQVGRQLRRLRTDRGETLTETADRAGISPQYLSEIERGRKDASSEMLAAVTGALGASLLDLTLAVAADLRVARPARPPRWGSPTCLAA